MSEHVTGIEDQENRELPISTSEEDVERGSREYEREREVQMAKDIMLRLRERNGRLRGKISAVEDRVQRGLRITGGIGVGGVVLLMVILSTLVLPLKGILFFFLLLAFRLRARSGFLSSLALTNYSEFGLIVASVALPDWLVPLAIAVSLSFIVSAPLNRLAHRTRRR